MKKRLIMLLTTMLLAVLVVSACGSKDVKKEVSKGKSDNSVEEEVKAKEETEKDKNKESEENVDKETEKESNTDNNSPSKDFTKMITYMEKETEGSTKVLYENNESQVHNSDGVSISLDSYVLVELNDFHTDFNIPFNNQTDGGVIIAQYTVKNELDKDAYFMPALYLSFTGAPKAYNNYRDLLPREDQLPEKISPQNDYLIKAGETITGYYAYPFSKDDLAKILELSTVAVEVPKPHSEKGDVNSNFGEVGKFTLSLNADGETKIANNEAFYQDRATREDMGEKKMLKEKDAINKSETLGDVTVTLDGYQFTEFTPNSEEAPRFASFKNGITLLTIKMKLDNKGTEDIGLSSMSSKLTVNDGAQYLLNEGMLLNYRYDEVIKAGETGELLQIFVLDQEQYEKIWKDKAFEFEVGPIRNTEAKDISKGKQAIFDLPK